MKWWQKAGSWFKRNAAKAEMKMKIESRKMDRSWDKFKREVGFKNN